MSISRVLHELEYRPVLPYKDHTKRVGRVEGAKKNFIPFDFPLETFDSERDVGQFTKWTRNGTIRLESEVLDFLGVPQRIRYPDLGLMDVHLIGLLLVRRNPHVVESAHIPLL